MCSLSESAVDVLNSNTWCKESDSEQIAGEHTPERLVKIAFVYYEHI